MATSRPSRYFPDELPAPARSLWNFTKGAGGSAEYLGHQITFVGLVLAAIPQTLKRYRRQTGVLLVDMTWGNGSIIVGGGVIGVLVFMGIAVGASVGIVGFSTLDMVGMGSLTGFISAYVNTREMAPMIAAIGFAAQAGCRMTAEIGAMRISEEIDALEAQGIRSIPFVVTTRVIAGVIIIVPLYVLTLLLAYGSCAFMVFFVHNQSQGVYKHYFDSFVHPVDVLYSVIKAVVFVVIIIAIQCYQGYYAGGGPEGVGMASGRAIRASLVAVVLFDMLLTLLFWGNNPGIQISG
ncbi:ABC transporter permease [Mycobacteroides franklinii]|uniref:Putative phospholipid ABC transporter permease protein MlaE n=1 Tax=Mycobacteroides franklinii TaxID=948102 RepID=A0A4V3HVC0_9MYCO|nr:ABC transporter permease [Mycobacteroides franklinii]TDZ43658.1 putative phospholipid ABC transporter permease protein MlaE [Mycobacteroides franklinii]TDZ50793.1 putative phospholipid ABC transporter permease protein MlaE [Mycobacteroides franklinii]TDZ57213.1 putative phospholipid ABC transporter permease protein MlaE [Mycobacteroides franklinii]TDZ64154.1 putative phospholipid ABC transporter permease protein MlaE [Mycobacteroides franklinii]TDZ70551.1 putative phospholipid ABC transport